jgi:hypothetical protein
MTFLRERISLIVINTLWCVCAESPDVIPLCSTGGAYSHVYGSCMRESRDWEQRKLFFHRWSAHPPTLHLTALFVVQCVVMMWCDVCCVIAECRRKQYYREQLMGRKSSSSSSSKPDERDAHDGLELGSDEEGSGADAPDAEDADHHKKGAAEDEDDVWTFAPSRADHDHDDL